DLMIEKIFERDADHSIGIMLLGVHPQVGLGQSKWVNLWVRDKSPNVNLSILISLQIKQNWDGNLRILQVVKNQEEAARARNYLTKLIRVMRIPDDAEIEVLVGDFSEALKKAPEADINIFGMASEVDLSWIRSVSEKVGTSVLFLRDSKIESAFA
ncbi:MAG: hypothetical protein JW928_03965, partial [Candidatus Aureabacteria bacterium]|nr:hypothetical protein [Candidatus Auribacterota bacterium]